jgi:hypothetical protein
MNFFTWPLTQIVRVSGMIIPFDGKGVWRSVGSQWIDIDKESVIWQLTTLIKRPNSAFRYFASRRHVQGMWARGNIRFALFEVCALLLSSILWYVFPEFPFSFKSLLINILTFAVRDFLIIGWSFSFIVSLILNRFGLAMRSYRESRQDVERRFCFDAFCNGAVAFLTDFMLGYFVLHICERLFSSNRIIQLFLPNTLFLLTTIHFLYLFVGTVNVLPFIKRLRIFYFAIPPICLYVLSLIFGWKIAFWCIASHFLGANPSIHLHPTALSMSPINSITAVSS